MSNYATPPQLVENVPYRDMGEMQDFARTWRDRHRGQWFSVSKLSGFCLLMKRAVYEAIGGLDERFGLGFFDDDDLAERARRAGFELAVAHDLFVHHFGSRTFAGNGIDAGKLLDENAGRFAAKWGLNGANGRRVALKPFVDPGGGAESREISRKAAKTAKNQIGIAFESGGTADAALVASEPSSSSFSAALRLGVRSSFVENSPSEDRGERPGVSLTIIARDEEKNLPNCLESVRGLFDEIVVIEPAARIARPRLHDRSVPRSSAFPGSTISPRRGMRPWNAPQVIMPFGSTPTTWLSRVSERS